MKQYLKIPKYIQFLYLITSIFLFILCFYFSISIESWRMFFIYTYAMLGIFFAIYLAILYNKTYSPTLYLIFLIVYGVLSGGFFWGFMIFLGLGIASFIILQKQFYALSRNDTEKLKNIPEKRFTTTPSKAIFICIIICGILIGGYRFTYYKWHFDFPEIDESFWLTTYHDREIPDEENIYLILKNTINDISVLTSDEIEDLKYDVLKCLIGTTCNTLDYYITNFQSIAPDTPFKNPTGDDVSQFLTSNIDLIISLTPNEYNTTMLNLLDTVSQKYLYSLGIDPMNERLENPDFLKILNTTLLLHTYKLLLQGKQQDAITYLSKTIQLQNHILQNDLIILDTFILVGQYNTLFSYIEYINTNFTLSPSLKSTIIKQLSRINLDRESIENAYKMEYIYLKDFFEQMNRDVTLGGSVSRHPFYNLNQSIEVLEYIIHQSIITQGKTVLPKKVENFLQPFPVFIFKENSIGRILLVALIPQSDDKVYERVYEFNDKLKKLIQSLE